MVSRSSSPSAYVSSLPVPSRTPSAHAAASDVAAQASGPRSQCGTSRSIAQRRRAGGTGSSTDVTGFILFLREDAEIDAEIFAEKDARARATIAAAAGGDARARSASGSSRPVPAVPAAFVDERSASHTSPRSVAAASASTAPSSFGPGRRSTSATSAGAAAGRSAASAAVAASLPRRDRSLSAPRNANAEPDATWVTAADQLFAALRMLSGPRLAPATTSCASASARQSRRAAAANIATSRAPTVLSDWFCFRFCFAASCALRSAGKVCFSKSAKSGR